METLASFLVQQPMNILGVAIALLLLWLAVRPHRKPLLMAAMAWLAYAAWEWLVQANSPEANIRVDLLLIWPVLGLLTLWAFLKLGISVLIRKEKHE
jgi:hypothetical protein